MNIAFIYFSAKVKQDTLGNLYNSGTYGSEFWQRYLQVADHITLVMRKESVIYEPEEAQKRFNIIDTTKIDFVELPDKFSSIKTFLNPSTRKKMKSTVFEQLQKNDGAIIRLPGAEFAVKCANKLNKPYLVEVVGCPFDSFWNHSLFGKILAIPSMQKLKRALKISKNAVYVTNKFLQKRYPTNGDSIGCSDVSIKNKEKIEALYDSKRKANPKIILGTAGAIDVRYKGQQYVIRALGELKKHGICNFEYQIAGIGDSSYLKSQIIKYNVEDEVKIVGSIPHDQISDWYKNLDVYVQPSKTEGLPRSLVEAMNEGVASVGSNVGGIPELLDDESVFKKGNVKEICKILIKFSDEAFRIKKAEECYKKSLEYNGELLDKKRLDFMKGIFCNAKI